MTMPNFLVIGAAKAGTTSLYRYLRQHPAIYMSPHKEPRFFALEGKTIDFQGPGDLTRFNFVTDIDSYRKLFTGVVNERAVGEVSPWYLYVSQSPERIKHYIPDVRLIAILRDPVDRAYSNFLHSVREQLEPLDDFAAAMEAEAGRIRDNWSYRWHYKQKGFYCPQLKRYFEMFSKDQIRVYLYDDFTSDPVSMLKDIYHFLEVDEYFEVDTTQRFNVAGVPKNKLLDRSLNRPSNLRALARTMIPSYRLRQFIKNNLRKINMADKPELPRDVREKYINEYRNDILELQDLLQKDLSKWLTI